MNTPATDPRPPARSAAPDAGAQPPARRRRWPLVLAAVLALGVLLVLAGAVDLVQSIAGTPVLVRIDGEPVHHGQLLAGLSTLEVAGVVLAVALALGLALLVGLVVLPLALGAVVLVAVGAAGGVLALGIGLPLVLAVAVLALVSLPLWLPLLLWVRHRRRAARASAAASPGGTTIAR